MRGSEFGGRIMSLAFSSDREVSNLFMSLAKAIPVILNNREQFDLALQNPDNRKLLFESLARLYLKFGGADESIIKLHAQEEYERAEKIRIEAASEKKRAKVLMNMYCAPGTILGEKGYLQLVVNAVDQDTLDIEATVLDNKDWTHVFAIGERTKWRWIHSYIWEEPNEKPTSTAAQSIMAIETSGVSFERDS